MECELLKYAVPELLAVALSLVIDSSIISLNSFIF